MKKLISAVACCLVAMSVALAANDQQAKTGCQNIPQSEGQASGEGEAA